jgi:hypothetical protein
MSDEPRCPQLHLVMLRVPRILDRTFPFSAPPIQAALFSTYIDFYLQQDRAASRNRRPACETRIVIRSCLTDRLRIAAKKVHHLYAHTIDIWRDWLRRCPCVGKFMLPISTVFSTRMCQHLQRCGIGLAASLACTLYSLHGTINPLMVLSVSHSGVGAESCSMGFRALSIDWRIQIVTAQLHHRNENSGFHASLAGPRDSSRTSAQVN